MGAVASLAALWQLSEGWYGDRLAPDYRPATIDRLQRLLDDAGLTGEFWKLPS